MKRSLLLSILFVLTGASCAGAGLLSPEASLERVAGEACVRRMCPSDGSTRGFRLAYSGEAGGVYLFDNPSGEGFLLVAGSDRYPALLGYSDSGRFDIAAAPPAFRDMLAAFDRQIALDEPLADHAFPQAEVAPLVKSRWDQRNPYNLRTPRMEASPTLTGCVATAMAQVAKYWNFPPTGNGTASYWWANGDRQLEYDFENTVFDYGDMLDVYDASSPAASCDAVAELMLACGMASKMNYSIDMSGAFEGDAAAGLVWNLGFDPGLRLRYRNFYDTEEWMDLLVGEFQAGRPVLYYGFHPTGGHAFIFDGYSAADGGMVHVNWGWSGVSDGYYRIDALDPLRLGSGAVESNYNMMQCAVVGLRPADMAHPGEISGGDVLCFGFFSVGQLEYDRSDEVDFRVATWSIRGYMMNVGQQDMRCRFGIKAVPEDGSAPFYIPCADEVTLAIGDDADSFVIPGAEFPVAGRFECRPAYCVDGVWTEMPRELQKKDHIVCEVKDDAICFEVASNPNGLVLDSFDLTTGKWNLNERVGLSAVVSARNSCGETTTVTPVVMQNGRVLDALPPRDVRLEAGGTVRLEWEYVPSGLPVDTYDVGLLLGQYNLLGDAVQIVLDDPELPLLLDTSEVRINNDIADSMNVNVVKGREISFSGKVYSFYRHFEGPVNVMVKDADGKLVKYLGAEDLSLSVMADEEVEVAVTGTTDGLRNDCEYTLSLRITDNVAIPMCGLYRAVFPDADASVDAVPDDSDVPAEYFNLQGIPVTAPSTDSVLIRRQGSATTKVIFE